MSIVRLQMASIFNVKNVKQGTIFFPSKLDKSYLDGKSDVVGIYGQNGSGKTAMITALRILGSTLSGDKFFPSVTNYIYQGSSEMHFVFEFHIYRPKTEGHDFLVEYSFSLMDETIPQQNGIAAVHIPHIVKESLKIKNNADSSKNMTTVVDTDVGTADETAFAFVPKTSFDSTIKHGDATLRNDFIYARRFAYDNGTSFIFSEKAIGCFKKSAIDGETMDVIFSLWRYGRADLSVIDTEDCNNFMMNVNFRLSANEGSITSGALVIPFTSSELPEAIYAKMLQILPSINTLLTALVPGIKVGVSNSAQTVLANGQIGMRFQLVSQRDGITIPIQYESGGIRKIISVLSCLISAYNNESILVAIDELDSGVFEYLLGEIVRVFSESGKGQLLFTSHNLRPLEILGNHGIYLTTTDKNNRYLEHPYVNDDSNFRNKYLREISLGVAESNGNAEYYSQTSEDEIRYAFKAAGKSNEP